MSNRIVRNVPVAHLALVTLAALAVLACNPAGSAPTTAPSPGASPLPSGTPGSGPTLPPSPSPVATQVTSAAQAAALVFESNPTLFAGISPLQREVFGQSAWYEASEAGDGYSVMVTIGSGDCMAGCINRSTWTYSVARDGAVELVSKEGDEVEVPNDPGTDDPATINVRLTAGPVCPVEQSPPDPNCAPRAITDAEVVLRAPSGAEIARGTTGEDGLVVFRAPGGAYYVEAMDVPEMMGQAEATAFAVVGGSSIEVAMQFDTGIR